LIDRLKGKLNDEFALEMRKKKKKEKPREKDA